MLRQASYVQGDARFVTAVARDEVRPVVSKASAKPAPKKEQSRQSERRDEPKKNAKPPSIKTLVAALDEDKPAATSGSGRSKAEAGLR